MAGRRVNRPLGAASTAAKPADSGGRACTSVEPGPRVTCTGGRLWTLADESPRSLNPSVKNEAAAPLPFLGAGACGTGGLATKIVERCTRGLRSSWIALRDERSDQPCTAFVLQLGWTSMDTCGRFRVHDLHRWTLVDVRGRGSEATDQKVGGFESLRAHSLRRRSEPRNRSRCGAIDRLTATLTAYGLSAVVFALLVGREPSVDLRSGVAVHVFDHGNVDVRGRREYRVPAHRL